jgi:hypothetical protein
MKNVKQRNDEIMGQGLHDVMDNVAIEERKYKGRQFRTSRLQGKRITWVTYEHCYNVPCFLSYTLTFQF